MFNSVVIATDVDAGPDRAIAVGASLARRGRLPVELLTVVTSRRGLDDVERQRTLLAHGVGGSLCVVHGEDIAGAIVDHVQNRDGALLVMNTSATGLVSGSRGSVSAHVLSELRQPVLLIGPAVPDPVHLASPTLVACTDRSQDIGAALPVIDAWRGAFGGGGRPWVVEVVPTAAWPAGAVDDALAGEHVEAVAAALADHGVDAATKVLHGGDPVRWLLEFAEDVEDAVFVATSDRWAGGHSHWYSTTRRLVQRSPRPVLVVPADRPGY